MFYNMKSSLINPDTKKKRENKYLPRYRSGNSGFINAKTNRPVHKGLDRWVNVTVMKNLNLWPTHV